MSNEYKDWQADEIHDLRQRIDALEPVVRQAIDALMSWTPTFRIAIDKRDEAITALRYALAKLGADKEES